jgi:polyhydroxyalkanoate synthesis regulator phasin
MKTMEPTQMVQQMIDLQKTAFENSYNAMIMFQSQTEKMAESMISQNSLIPEEGQKMINEWILAYKKGREDFKKSVDENFTKMEEFFSTAAKASKTASK